MKKMGRPRKSAPGAPTLPPGVRKIKGRYYWQPSSASEKEARREAGLPVSVALGADLTEARKAWGNLTREQIQVGEAGTVAEILIRYRDKELTSENEWGEPKYAAKTRTNYEHALAVLLEEFGSRQYALNEAEASKGRKLRTMDVQRWLDKCAHGASANRTLATFSSAFRCAKRWGYTEYNPCIGVEYRAERARKRDVKPWEVQVLLVAAETRVNRKCSVKSPGWNMALMIRLADITGASGQDIRALRRDHLTAEGIEITRGKTGNERLARWTPELRKIIDEALAIGPEVRGAIFCNRYGLPYTESGFQSQWRRVLTNARKLAREAGLPALPNLHFHDIRKKAGNDAKEQGASMHEFLGNKEATARKHYLTRPTKVKPTK
jgi:site-specific recombinase XerD